MRRSLLFAVTLAACGSADEPGETDAASSGWRQLISKSWQLEPGTENTSDTEIITLDGEIFAGGIRPIAPVGTHHTVLFRGPSDVGGLNIIYASGVGTNELTFPPGVGLRLSSGMLLGLQLHIFNTSNEPIAGTSGIEVLNVEPSALTEEADLLLAGPTDLEIPPGVSTVTGTCTVSQRQTVFAVFPHMHQLGTHLKTTMTIGGVERVIHDGPYEFNDQAFLPMDPVVLEPGDTITTECTYNNTTDATVNWGESSTTEMCFSILYRFPAVGERC